MNIKLSLSCNVMTDGMGMGTLLYSLYIQLGFVHYKSHRFLNLYIPQQARTQQIRMDPTTTTMDDGLANDPSPTTTDSTSMAMDDGYIGIGMAMANLLLTIIISILLWIIHWSNNNIIRRLRRMRLLISYLNYTMMKQHFPSSIVGTMLRKVGYDYEKLENDRNDFMKWCFDPQGTSYRQPDDMFTPAAADDEEYVTVREIDAVNFWKVEKGPGTSTSSDIAAAKMAMTKSQEKSVPKSIRTTFTQPDEDNGLYENPQSVKPTAAGSKAKKSGKSSVKTSYTQDDDGLYEDVNKPEPASKKSEQAKTAAGATSRSKTSRGSKSRSKRMAASGQKSAQKSSRKTGSSSDSTESGGVHRKASTKTAYNSADGEYENLENLALE